MFRLTIRTKLATLLSILSLLGVGTILWLVKASFDKGFQDYLNEAVQRNLSVLATDISRHANNQDSWQRFITDPQQWDTYFREYRERQETDDSRPPRRNPIEPLQPPRPNTPSRANGAPWLQGPGRLPPPPRANGRPVWLLDQDQRVIYGPPLPEMPADDLMQITIKTAGHPVAYLATRRVKAHDNAADKIFAEQQHQLFFWIAVAAVFGSVLLSLPVSRYLVTPVQALSKAMHGLMRRQYDQHVPVKSNDELGDLARDFNLMAQTLNAYDSQQRQWLADISHELRTPLGVLKGELEAVQDGIMPFDQTTVASLTEEVVQLSRLVDDLHQLAITQSSHLRYNIAPTNIAELITRLSPRLENLMHSAALDFALQLPSAAVWIDGDSQRLEQLIMNLAQNSVRYTDPGGQVRLKIDVTENVTLIWEDSAPGVDEQDLHHLFDRFYRTEKSRQRAIGGSGLGLFIVSNIAEAHNATLSAQASELGGLSIKIMFPGGAHRA